MTLGEFLRGKRDKAGLSMLALSVKSEVDDGTISRIENDKVQALLLTVIHLCEALNIKPMELAKTLQLREPLPALECGYEKSAEQNILSIEDILAFVKLFQTKEQYALEILTELVNRTSARHRRYQMPSNEYNSQYDIQKLELPDIRAFFADDQIYTVELNYPPAVSGEIVLQTYAEGGMLTQKDIWVYISDVYNKQKKPDKSAKRLYQRLSVSTARSLEISGIVRVKLDDVLTADKLWSEGGEIFGMFWKAIKQSDLLMKNIRSQKILSIAYLLIKTYRWWQYLDTDDLEWINYLHSELESMQN